MIRLSIRRPVAVSMAYLAVALLGVAAWRNIPIELLPDTELPQLTIIAEWPNASPEATEAFVTAPLEAAVQQVQDVEKIMSVSEDSRRGFSSTTITAEFARDSDMDFVRLDLSERLAAIEDDLPAGVTSLRVEPYTPDEFADQQSPFLSYTVTGPYTLEALRTHVEDRIVPELTQVDGVAGIDVYGGRGRVLELALDETQINALGLSSYVVAQRIRELEYVAEAGLVEIGGVLRTLAIRHRTETADEIRRTPLLTDRGRVVRVDDVATVHDTFEEPYQYYRVDGQPAVAFRVFKEIRVNTVRVADDVKKRIAEIEEIHPAGVRLILDDDQSKDIKAQLQDLRLRAMVAATVIFAVLLLFLRSFRSAAIIFTTIGFSVLIALNLIYFGGFTLNVLTLMGLAMGFGLIVDNAIVVVENIYRKRRAGTPASEAAHAGARQVLLPILASTLTTLIVFIPFVYLQGELRIFYVPLAIAVGMSLLASLLVAFTFIPALAARSLVRGIESKNGADVQPPLYVRAYAAMLRVTTRWPWATVAVAAVIFAASYRLFDQYVNRGIVWGRWGTQDTYIAIQIRLPRGAELERTDELVRFFEEKLKQLPEVDRFVTRVQPQWGFVRVTFPDSLETTQAPVATKEQLVAYSYLFAGAEVRVYGYGPSFYGGGGGAPNYSLKVLGYNYEGVREIAEDLGRRLTRFSRVQDVDVNSSGGWFQRDKATEFTLSIDRSRLGLHALTAQDVIRQVQAAVSGQQARSNIRVGGEEVRFDVKLAGHEDLDVLKLEELLLQTPGGQGVRLGVVASIAEREVLNRVVRENQQYQRNVAYEFRGPQKLGDRVYESVIAATQVPDGYKVEGRDEWRWSDEERSQIYGVLAVSLVLIFMVTAALFESVRQPLCVLLTVPMALVGVFLMFFYTDASFTREAYIGVIMMGGIVVNNAILLIDHVNHLRRVDGLQLGDAVIRGTLERVRPILMTSVTTILGLLPLVLFSEYADANIWNALGYALIGGLASSTVFVLTVTPAMYLLFERRPERHRVTRLQTADAV